MGLEKGNHIVLNLIARFNFTSVRATWMIICGVRRHAIARARRVIFFFFFFFAGGVAMVLQHRYFIQKTLSTGTICSHGYGFDIYALITAFRKEFV